MSRILIQGAIKSILETVDNIGQVHDTIRWTVHEGEYIENFAWEQDGQLQIRTWMIYRESGGLD